MNLTPMFSRLKWKLKTCARVFQKSARRHLKENLVVVGWDLRVIVVRVCTSYFCCEHVENYCVLLLPVWHKCGREEACVLSVQRPCSVVGWRRASRNASGIENENAQVYLKSDGTFYFWTRRTRCFRRSPTPPRHNVLRKRERDAHGRE